MSDQFAQQIAKGHTTEVWRCEFSPDSTLCITTAWDGIARVWDVDTDALIEKAQASLMKGRFEPRDLEPYRAILGDRIEELVAR